MPGGVARVVIGSGVAEGGDEEVDWAGWRHCLVGLGDGAGVGLRVDGPEVIEAERVGPADRGAFSAERTKDSRRDDSRAASSDEVGGGGDLARDAVLSLPRNLAALGLAIVVACVHGCCDSGGDCDLRRARADLKRVTGQWLILLCPALSMSRAGPNPLFDFESSAKHGSGSG